MNFIDKLAASVARTGSVLCVGLDPLPTRLSESVESHCRRIVEATLPYAAAYKPNLAFFEALGPDGWAILDRIRRDIPSDRIVIADAKRGDIGNTAERYAHAMLHVLDADAVTVNPLMGLETVAPYLTDATKAAYVLALTSNPGAADYLFDLAPRIAADLATLTQPGHAGMVVGATHPERLPEVLRHHPDAALLIPGVGTQGGSVEALAKALAGHRGLPLVNVTRDIEYAANPAEAAKRHHAALQALMRVHA